MLILGLESTCDETSAAVVKDGTVILSNIVASSASMHQKYGGIVPEVAAREQIKVIIPTIEESLRAAGIKSQDLDAIAIAYGPGLIGSLLIGTETAKALALAWNKPLIGVNHLIGHIYANWLAPVGISNFKFQISNSPKFPLIALLVSGGHTDLIYMKGHGNFKWLGGTRDDSVGEAFDKVARVLGLKYPGGPEIERLAISHQRLEVSKFKFPRPMAGSGDFDFSFSGLKTAVVNLVNPYTTTLSPSRKRGSGFSTESRITINRAEVAYDFQEAVCDVLIKKTFAAAEKFGVKTVIVGGGVSANTRLRERFNNVENTKKICVLFPQKNLSTDNGAMIAAAAFFNQDFVDPLKLRADPNLYFDFTETVDS